MQGGRYCTVPTGTTDMYRTSMCINTEMSSFYTSHVPADF